MNKIETAAWIHGTDWQLSEGSGVGGWMKEGEEIKQKNHIHINIYIFMYICI